ncbi:MAG TPA: hypothetical protein EYN67_17800 [Flavobacteriales bacterium]|nr:hypothetical protein [Flavobacteriales bacterium]
MFNIKKHEFEDGDIVDANPAMGQRLFLNFSDSVMHVQLCEKDVIAMANHYGYLNHLKVGE